MIRGARSELLANSALKSSTDQFASPRAAGHAGGLGSVIVASLAKATRSGSTRSGDSPARGGTARVSAAPPAINQARTTHILRSRWAGMWGAPLLPGLFDEPLHLAQNMLE